MKTKGFFLVVVLLLVTGGFAQAAEKDLGATVDVTWVSKYIWRGIDMLDDKAAIQPSVDLDLWGTGFHANLFMSYAGSAGDTNTGLSRVDATEYRYGLSYQGTHCEGQSMQVDYFAQWIYYDFIDQATRIRDAQEWGAGFAMPNIIGNGWVPSYYIGKIYPTRSNSVLGGQAEGWVHVIGLDYAMKLAPIMPDTAEQPLLLGAALVYNDGFAGATVKHDWSHVTWSAKAPLDMGGFTLTPGVYYQTSMEDSVNTEDELYASLSTTFKF